jgi:hypothetical protein
VATRETVDVRTREADEWVEQLRNQIS